MSLTNKIQTLKEANNAVILAHYYVPDEVQAVADYVGDSFYLSKLAKDIDVDTIVFCGVSFMGESAKILSPDKKVLIPDMTADCAMAHMADLMKVKEMREKYEKYVFGVMMASCPMRTASRPPFSPLQDITVAFGANSPSRISSQPMSFLPLVARNFSIDLMTWL